MPNTKYQNWPWLPLSGILSAHIWAASTNGLEETGKKSRRDRRLIMRRKPPNLEDYTPFMPLLGRGSSAPPVEFLQPQRLTPYEAPAWEWIQGRWIRTRRGVAAYTACSRTPEWLCPGCQSG